MNKETRIDRKILGVRVKKKHFHSPLIYKRAKARRWEPNIIPKILIVAFLILILIFPSSSLQGAKQGLLLWFHTVLPTLLPFIILSNLIIGLNIASYISKLLYPIFRTLFGVNLHGCYPILIGFLSGIPVGAKSVADLVKEEKITTHEGQFLLGFCNNASPMFIMSFIAISQLNKPELRMILLLVLYLSAILSSLLYFRLIKPNPYKAAALHKNIVSTFSLSETPTSRKKFQFAIVDTAIMNGFEVITKVGGYIILFSIPATIMTNLMKDTNLGTLLIIGLLEITTGIHVIASTQIAIGTKIILITVLTAFGGLSGLAQTNSVIQDTNLSIISYLKVKLLQVIIAFLLISFYTIVMYL